MAERRATACMFCFTAKDGPLKIMDALTLLSVLFHTHTTSTIITEKFPPDQDILHDALCQADEAAVPSGLGDARAVFRVSGRVVACTGLTAVANMDGRPLRAAH